MQIVKLGNHLSVLFLEDWYQIMLICEKWCAQSIVNVICMYVVGVNRFWMAKERWECRKNSLLSMWFVSRFFPWVTWSVSYFLCFIRCCFCVLFQHKNQVHLMLVFSNKIRHKITRAQKSSRGEIETILCSFSHQSNMPSLIIL